MRAEMPVFPLNLPLLPGCSVPLQIFENRYLEMVADCMKHHSGFVVVLLKEGEEGREVNTGKVDDSDPPFYTVGTYADIIDFGQRENGLLSIVIQGRFRCELIDITCADSGLWLATTEKRPESGELNDVLSSAHQQILRRIISEQDMATLGADLNQLSAEQSMNYLITLLPFPPEIKQTLIAMDSIEQRETELAVLLSTMGSG